MAQPPRIVTPSDLDAVALARLHELDPDGRHGVVYRVMTAFEGSLVRMMTQLDAQRAPDGHASVVSGVAHTLKSSSASVGALQLSTACAAVELALRERPEQELEPHIAQLMACSEAALMSVRAMLQS